jgi:hypothetical protein
MHECCAQRNATGTKGPSEMEQEVGPQTDGRGDGSLLRESEKSAKGCDKTPLKDLDG